MKTDVRARIPDGTKLVDETFSDFFNPEKTAVVSIDMIRSHLGHPTDCPCPGGEEAITSIEVTDEFHRRVRAAGVPIIHARSYLRRGAIDDPRGDRATWRRLLEWNSTSTPLLDEHVVEGTEWVDFLTEVEEGDLIVHKKRMSAFAATDLDFLLRNLGVEIVIIDGIFADACDLSTAFQATDLDYKVMTVDDVVCGSNDQMKSSALDIFATYIGLVVNSDQLVSEWEARRATVGIGA